VSDLAGVKVGDKLFVTSRMYGSAGRIVRVGRITPSGRVITTVGEFNPNGRMRGAEMWARPATYDDIASLNRYRLVQKLERFQLWDNLSADDLRAVSEIVAKYAEPQKARGEP
jgi:hypothetical protein